MQQEPCTSLSSTTNGTKKKHKKNKKRKYYTTCVFKENVLIQLINCVLCMSECACMYICTFLQTNQNHIATAASWDTKLDRILTRIRNFNRDFIFRRCCHTEYLKWKLNVSSVFGPKYYPHSIQNLSVSTQNSSRKNRKPQL